MLELLKVLIEIENLPETNSNEEFQREALKNPILKSTKMSVLIMAYEVRIFISDKLAEKRSAVQ